MVVKKIDMYNKIRLRRITLGFIGGVPDPPFIHNLNPKEAPVCLLLPFRSEALTSGLWCNHQYWAQGTSLQLGSTVGRTWERVREPERIPAPRELESMLQ